MQDKDTRFKVSDADPTSVENTKTGQLAAFPSKSAVEAAVRMLRSGELDASDLYWRDAR